MNTNIFIFFFLSEDDNSPPRRRSSRPPGGGEERVKAEPVLIKPDPDADGDMSPPRKGKVGSTI